MPIAGGGSRASCTAALDLEGDARATYLAEACGDDAALRREVEALLARDASAQRFLAAPGAPAKLQLANRFARGVVLSPDGRWMAFDARPTATGERRRWARTRVEP